jgi:hypothetical protein
MLVETGALPGVGVGATAALGIETGPIVVELEGVILPARRARVANHATASGRVGLWAVGAAARWAAVRGGLSAGPSAALEIGWATGEGDGVSDPARGGGLWMAARGGAFATVEVVDWLALHASAEAVVPLSRPSFVLDGVGEVFEPAVVSGRLGLGAEARFR